MAKDIWQICTIDQINQQNYNEYLIQNISRFRSIVTSIFVSQSYCSPATPLSSLIFIPQYPLISLTSAAIQDSSNISSSTIALKQSIRYSSDMRSMISASPDNAAADHRHPDTHHIPQTPSPVDASKPVTATVTGPSVSCLQYHPQHQSISDIIEFIHYWIDQSPGTITFALFPLYMP